MLNAWRAAQNVASGLVASEEIKRCLDLDPTLGSLSLELELGLGLRPRLSSSWESSSSTSSSCQSESLSPASWFNSFLERLASSSLYELQTSFKGQSLKLHWLVRTTRPTK